MPGEFEEWELFNFFSFISLLINGNNKESTLQECGSETFDVRKKTFFYALNNMQQSRDDGELEAKTPTCRNQGTTADFISPLKRPH